MTTYRELVTIDGKNVVLAHNEPPVINAGVLENGDIFRMFNIFAEAFSPSNIDKADGTPLRLYTSDRVKIMHPGDMLMIPKGIGHRSMLCEDSTDDNVLIELKIADDLTYVGENK